MESGKWKIKIKNKNLFKDIFVQWEQKKVNRFRKMDFSVSFQNNINSQDRLIPSFTDKANYLPNKTQKYIVIYLKLSDLRPGEDFKIKWEQSSMETIET